MKNWTIERFMQKQLETEVLDDPDYYLYQLSNLCAIAEESNGQFTGGYCSTKYIYQGMVYEFDYYMDEIDSATIYPEEFL